VRHLFRDFPTEKTLLTYQRPGGGRRRARLRAIATRPREWVDIATAPELDAARVLLDAPILKLPYNANENSYAAAQRFLHANELPMGYIDQIADFIEQNAGGVKLGSSGNAYEFSLAL
jgi:hypothetical protein